jgi:DNA-binding response OmpR family regulator
VQPIETGGPAPIEKPFQPDELVERVKSLLVRPAPGA